MPSDSGSWYANHGTWYYFHKWMAQLTQDQLPQDYEEQVHDPRLCGRLRYCHALLDRCNNSDTIKLCNMLNENLFEESSGFTPWEHEVHEGFKVNRNCEIFNYIESIRRDERYKNIDKLLIVVKFGVFATNYNRDDSEIDEEEIRFVPASKSSIQVLEKVSDFDSEFGCAICFEEEKKEAKRMPCGHTFHDQCIEQWLNKSHLCPLCRYTMPHDL
ncbi:hypothetical protein V6N13_117082 [Hibiscus sabdariffa]|uniref:RING-type E3 ubiquitin transferase n=1 Tax=Hibiscus sabdariffa TaxID=183260 RepID=A0ABR2QHD0_9ROSI